MQKRWLVACFSSLMLMAFAAVGYSAASTRLDFHTRFINACDTSCYGGDSWVVDNGLIMECYCPYWGLDAPMFTECTAAAHPGAWAGKVDSLCQE